MILRVRGYYLRLQLAVMVSIFTTMITIGSFNNKRRMSHENGITCRGRVRIVDYDPKLVPPNRFFHPGREFDCRVRHGTVLFKDDAKMTVRSASIKFADEAFHAPFDMLMNTGEVGLFWNGKTFIDFARMTNRHGKFFVPYLQKYPQALYGGGRSSRRNPRSFTDLSYNSQTCFGYISVDGTYYYVRYRLIGMDWERQKKEWEAEKKKTDAEKQASAAPDQFQEEGALSEWWADHNWLQNPYPEEERSRNYLKDELAARLEGDGTVQYKLQIQLRKKPPGAERQWVSAKYEWYDDVVPWRDIAIVTLTDVCTHEENMLTWFDLENHPEELPVPMGVSLEDPHSLNNFRKAGKWAARARLLSYRLKGMPEPFGDSRLEPDWEPVPPMLDPPGPKPATESTTETATAATR
jgi:arachidonate 5-lipoxygenase